MSDTPKEKILPLQTRIFVPPMAPYQQECWVECVVGHIIAPLVKKYQLHHFWFSRYGEGAEGSKGDTDLTKIPPGFELNGLYRSVRFRLWLPESQRAAFEQELRATVTGVGCWIFDLRDYPDLDDLASKRFCGGNFAQTRREERRDEMREFLSATARLFVHMLESPNSQQEFRLEDNTERNNNTEGVTFQSVHHLFCNMTEVPLFVFVDTLTVGTHIYPFSSRVKVDKVRVRF
jgi:hypothetical protein